MTSIPSEPSVAPSQGSKFPMHHGNRKSSTLKARALDVLTFPTVKYQSTVRVTPAHRPAGPARLLRGKWHSSGVLRNE